MSQNFTVYYIHDPMCSWCWGFRPTWNKVLEKLPANANIKYVLGGLAPDTEQPMTDEMQANIQETWKIIQKEIPGTQFNFDFWKECLPRRSTYPSCRAIISASNQEPNAASKMLLAIQQAYYLNAKNPSDKEVLIGLAAKLDLDTVLFAEDLNAKETHKKLLEEFELRHKLDVHSFPGIVAAYGNSFSHIDIDYNNADNILRKINSYYEK